MSKKVAGVIDNRLSLETIRDYERQLADLRYRLGVAETDAALWKERYFETIRVHASDDPQYLLDKMRIMGIPARDVKAIYEIEEEWHKNGGTQAMVDWWKLRQEVEKMIAS